MLKVERVLVTVHDNDFSTNTLLNLLDTLHRAIQDDYSFSLDTDAILNLIKEGVLFHYKAFQNPTESDERYNNVEKYLLKNLKVWFNKEADQVVSDITMHGSVPNGEYVYLDIKDNILMII